MPADPSIADHNPHGIAEPLVDVTTVATLLSVRRNWVYEAAWRGELPCYRVGRYLRFRVSEIEQWLSENGRRYG